MTALAGIGVAFADGVLEPDPTWTRLDSTDSLVASYSIRRGRQDELEKTGTGTASITLNDTGGLFDPNNAASPYYGSIDGRQAGIALWDPVAGTWTTIFRGFVDGYDYQVHPSGVVTKVELELVDALDYIAGVEIAPGSAGHSSFDGDVLYAEEEVDDRIRKVLSDIGWPSELRTIFSGNVVVKESAYPAGASSLQVLQDAADAEFPGVANVYVSALGMVTFHGRHARFDPDTTAGSAGGAWDFTRWQVSGGGIAAESPDYAQIRGLSFARSRKRIVNAALAYPMRDETDPITDAEMRAQIVLDDAPGGSIETYGVRSWSAENLLTKGHKTNPTDDLEETRLFGQYYVDNYKQPQTRVTQLVFRSIEPTHPRGPETWALLCGVEISDIVELTTVHPGGGGFGANEFYVEGISYDVRPLNPDYQDVTLTLDISPFEYYTTNPFGD